MKITKVNSRAFSLAELLVVVAIMSLMAVLVMPGFTQTLRASKLTTSGQSLVDELNLARQTAMSRNTPVEVRFYKLPDHEASSDSSPTVYRATQIFILSGGTSKALDRPKFLPAPVILSPRTNESAFLSSTNTVGQTAPADSPVTGYGTNYSYRCMRFAPGGSVDIQNTESFFTLVLQQDRPLTEGANYFTVQVHPISGSVRSFRP